MLNDIGGREKLLALGVRNVPVVAQGGKFVFGQNLEDVAKFVGLEGTGHLRLPPDQLIVKWLLVLRAVQRYIRQMPASRIDERVIDNRDRSIRMIGHHVFRIAEAFLEAAVDGAEYTPLQAKAETEDATTFSGEQIAIYGEHVMTRLQGWWDQLSDRGCSQPVTTFFGVHPLHLLLERSTWHCAQHARQLIAVLERFGIEPEGRISAADLAGLPLPERLWE